MFGVSAFYLLLVLGPTPPFATLAIAPPDGRGPLPLLQNHPLMAVAPAVPVPRVHRLHGAVRVRDRGADHRPGDRRVDPGHAPVDDLGLDLPDRSGCSLGALWSYGVLGWGGYWAWDPVENVALLPWLVATAFLHSVMVQERRGMLKVWNLSLVVGTFALTVLGTFLTRGSILSSVHTFAESTVGPMYLAFLVLVLLGGFGLIAWRREALCAPRRRSTRRCRARACSWATTSCCWC